MAKKPLTLEEQEAAYVKERSNIFSVLAQITDDKKVQKVDNLEFRVKILSLIGYLADRIDFCIGPFGYRFIGDTFHLWCGDQSNVMHIHIAHADPDAILLRKQLHLKTPEKSGETIWLKSDDIMELQDKLFVALKDFSVYTQGYIDVTPNDPYL